MTKRGLLTSLLMGSVLALGIVGYIAIRQESAGTASVRTYVTADIDSAVDEQDLVNRATLVVVGTPTGKVDEKVTTEDGVFASYYQTVRLHEVLIGETADKTIRVVRAGVSSKMKDKTVVEGLKGALPQGKMILFLQPSAEAGVMQVVGHFSGELALDAANKVSTVATEVQIFKGLDIAAVRKKVGELHSK